MYPEFIPIYAGLVIIIALLVVILCVVIKRTSKTSSAQKWISSTGGFQGEQGTIVFCKNCATKFNSLQRICPKCGTSR